MQKDDPSFLTRPEASDAEQRPGKAGVGGGGVELGKGEVNSGDKGKGSEPEITEWRGGGGTSPRRGGEPGAEMTEWR